MAFGVYTRMEERLRNCEERLTRLEAQNGHTLRRAKRWDLLLTMAEKGVQRWRVSGYREN